MTHHTYMKTTLIIVLCSVAILASGCATSHSHSAAWEYKVVELDDYPGKLEAKLNGLASEGWVVVSATTIPRSESMVPYSSVVLKRHKQ